MRVFHKFGRVFHKFTEKGEFYIVWFLALTAIIENPDLLQAGMNSNVPKFSSKNTVVGEVRVCVNYPNIVC